MAKPGTRLSDIRQILSHEQALGQCHKFLDSLEDVQVTGTSNTAVAAREVSESGRRDIAAISSAECADLYGLEIIKDDIQISDQNFTRFICISKELEIYPGDNKISLLLKVPHKPMSLYHTLGKLSTLGINICKLESRPLPGSDFEFYFYFDLETTIADPEVRQVLSELERELDMFVFLGAYQEV
jgi:chorismate mutase/prephenate dehydratase